jgi:hypothetical protein
VKKTIIAICLIIVLIVVGSIGCVPTRSDRQLANIEAQLQNLTSALASTQQELATAKQALATAQEKTRQLEQQTRSTANNYGITTNYTPTPVATSIAPTVVSFTASPMVMVAGQASNLQWNVTGADWVSITPGIGNVALTGTQTVYPIASTTYILTATNSAGSVTGYATITVSQPYTAPTYPYYSGYPQYPPSYFPPVTPRPPRPPFPFPPHHPPFSGNHTPPHPPFPPPP